MFLMAEGVMENVTSVSLLADECIQILLLSFHVMETLVDFYFPLGANIYNQLVFVQHCRRLTNYVTTPQ